MLNLTYVLIQSIVQSLTEFLPVSSSGHMLMAKHWFGLQNPGLTLDLVLHLATTCTVVVYLFVNKRLVDGFSYVVLKKIFIFTLVSTGVTGVVGILLSDWVHEFYSLKWLGFNYMFMGSVLFLVKYENRFPIFGTQKKGLPSMTLMDAMVVGMFQSIGVFPGISRSGITIVGMLLWGFERSHAFLYSFLLAIPTIGAAFFYEVVSNPQDLKQFDVFQLGFGFCLTAVISYPLLGLLRKMIQRRQFFWFCFYCWGIGTALLFSG
jgi:undecaprenyl-diphosphatase